MKILKNILILFFVVVFMMMFNVNTYAKRFDNYSKNFHKSEGIDMYENTMDEFVFCVMNNDGRYLEKMERFDGKSILKCTKVRIKLKSGKKFKLSGIGVLRAEDTMQEKVNIRITGSNAVVLEKGEYVNDSNSLSFYFTNKETEKFEGCTYYDISILDLFFNESLSFQYGIEKFYAKIEMPQKIEVRFDGKCCLEHTSTDYKESNNTDAGDIYVYNKKDFNVKIKNVGDKDLVLRSEEEGGPLTFENQSSGVFSVKTLPEKYVLKSQESTTVVVTYSSFNIYEYIADMVIHSNDPRGNTSNKVKFQGVVSNISLYSNEEEITDNSTCKKSNNTDFGTICSMNETVEKEFVIKNEGNIDLIILEDLYVEGCDEFTISEQPTKTIAPDSEQTFKVLFTPTSSGEKNTSVIIRSNSYSHKEFNLKLKVNVEQLPEIKVTCNNEEIINNSEDINKSKGTLFVDNEYVIVGETITRKFIIKNEGNIDLNLIGNPIIEIIDDLDNEFSILQIPSSTVSGNSSTEFIVNFIPVSIGNKTAKIKILNNDVDESEYQFKIGSKVVPVISFEREVIDIPEGEESDITINFSGICSESFNIVLETECESNTESDFYLNEKIINVSGGTSKNAHISIYQDAIYEDDECVYIKIKNSDMYKVQQGMCRVNIIDNDGPPNIFIENYQAINEDEGTFNIFVTLNTESGKIARCRYDVISLCDSDKGGNDYSYNHNEILEYVPGETDKIIKIMILNDDIYEIGEQFKVVLKDFEDAYCLNDTCICDIFDDDSDKLSVITVDDVSVNEGNETNIEFVLDKVCGKDIKVDYEVDYLSTEQNQATKDLDYNQIQKSTLTIPRGELSNNITIQTNEDIIDELDENIVLKFTNPIDCNLANTSSKCTIIDDDGVPSLSFELSEDMISELNGSCDVIFNLFNPSAQEIDVDLIIEGATITDDYVFNKNIVFLPGEIIKIVKFESVDNNVKGENKVVNIKLNSSGEYNLGEVVNREIIIEDDDQPKINIRCKDKLITNNKELIFKDIRVKNKEEIKLIIKNTGKGELVLNDISITGEKMDLLYADNFVQTTLEKNEIYEYKLVYKNSEVEENSYGITIDSDSKQDSNYKIDLKFITKKKSSSGKKKDKVSVNGVSKKVKTKIEKDKSDSKKLKVEVDLKDISKKEIFNLKDNTLNMSTDKETSEFRTIIPKDKLEELKKNNVNISLGSKNVKYIINPNKIDIKDISNKMKENVSIKDLDIELIIKDSNKEIKNNDIKLIVKPIDFNIVCKKDGKEVYATKFNNYVEREILIPEGISPDEITTAVVVKDNNLWHIPTIVKKKNGKYYAIINSLTNSTYTLIFNKKTFSDIDKCENKEIIENMASRLIIKEKEDNKFKPKDKITRSEFVDIIVNALGLRQLYIDNNSFEDVELNSDYYNITEVAKEFKLVIGYGDSTFKEDDYITKEEALVIINRALKLSNLKEELTDEQIYYIISRYDDFSKVSKWSREAIAISINNKIYDDKNRLFKSNDGFTREEAVKIINKMLKVAKLI